MPHRRRRSLHPPWQAESGKTAGVEAVKDRDSRQWRGRVRRDHSPKTAAVSAHPCLQASFGPPSNTVFISAAMHPHLVLDPAVPGNNTHSNPTSSSLYYFTHCIPDRDQGQRSIGKHPSVQKADHTHLLRFLLLSSYTQPTNNQHTTRVTSINNHS